MKKTLTTICLASLVLTTTLSNAATNTQQGKITSYNTGWSTHTVRVTIEGSTYSEIPLCPVRDGYIVTKDTSDTEGFSTHVSALLSAFVSGKPVVLTVEGCVFGRPKVIGVSITQ